MSKPIGGGKSGCGKVMEKALIIDSFGRPFTFVLPNVAKEYKSLIGSILTMMTIITVALYGVYKWVQLLDKEETSLSQRIIEGYFDKNEHTFNQEEGFNIAVGIYQNLKRT